MPVTPSRLYRRAAAVLGAGVTELVLVTAGASERLELREHDAHGDGDANTHNISVDQAGVAIGSVTAQLTNNVRNTGIFRQAIAEPANEIRVTVSVANANPGGIFGFGLRYT